MALSRYLSRDEFEHYLSVVSKLFSFDPALKKWKPNASKIASYTPEEVRQIVDELRRIGMVGPELDEAIKIAENMGDYAYELSGNYIKLRARRLPLDSIRSEASAMKLRRMTVNYVDRLPGAYTACGVRTQSSHIVVWLQFWNVLAVGLCRNCSRFRHVKWRFTGLNQGSTSSML